jgi:hypothetical protein
VENIIKYGAIAFVIFFFVTAPDSAAHLIHRSLDGLHYLGTHLSTFVNSVV